jgi:hypothetical protein
MTGGQPISPRSRRLIGLIILGGVVVAGLIVMVDWLVLRPGSPPQRLDTPIVAHELAAGNVDRLTIVGHTVSGELKKAIGGGPRSFTTTADDPAALVALVLARNDGADIRVRSVVAQGNDAEQTRFDFVAVATYLAVMTLPLLVRSILRSRRLR